jgi:hypothetical protein
VNTALFVLSPLIIIGVWDAHSVVIVFAIYKIWKKQRVYGYSFVHNQSSWSVLFILFPKKLISIVASVIDATPSTITLYLKESNGSVFKECCQFVICSEALPISLSSINNKSLPTLRKVLFCVFCYLKFSCYIFY